MGRYAGWDQNKMYGKEKYGLSSRGARLLMQWRYSARYSTQKPNHAQASGAWRCSSHATPVTTGTQSFSCRACRHCALRESTHPCFVTGAHSRFSLPCLQACLSCLSCMIACLSEAASNIESGCRTSATVDLGRLTRTSDRLTALTLERRRDGQSETLADALPQLTGLQELVLLDSGVRTRDIGLPARGGIFLLVHKRLRSEAASERHSLFWCFTV